MAPAERKERVLLKLSGEALLGGRPYGIDPPTLRDIARQLLRCHEAGVEVAVVVAAATSSAAAPPPRPASTAPPPTTPACSPPSSTRWPCRTPSRRRGCRCAPCPPSRSRRSPSPTSAAAPSATSRRGRIVLLAAGTGNPYVTTDTAAALRGVEVGAQRLLMGKTGVDGVYTTDPATDPTAERYDSLSYGDAITGRVQVMDTAALSLCEENDLPIVVFDISPPEAIVRAVIDRSSGTVVGTAPTKLTREAG